MIIKDLESFELLSDACTIAGRGSTVATGAVDTGYGYAAGVAYAGAAGNNTATNADVTLHTRAGSWSTSSYAQARAQASAYNQGQSSHSSYSASSRFTGFSGGFIRINRERYSHSG